ncbi:hypothetical protein PVAG01_10450 [Phlyctema vagabunda]|uniref:Uncharacterized protein n=1 Tax=Phlyctema vagabunda TaxID=108571 RepID=A0ABR4P605_9HELO
MPSRYGSPSQPHALNEEDLNFITQRLRSPKEPLLKSRLATYFEGYMEFADRAPSPCPTESDSDHVTVSTSTEIEWESQQPSVSPERESIQVPEIYVNPSSRARHSRTRQVHRRRKPSKKRSAYSSNEPKPSRKVDSAYHNLKSSHTMLTRSKMRSRVEIHKKSVGD